MSFLDFDLFMVPDSGQVGERCFGGGAKGVLIVLRAPADLREEMETFVGKIFAAAQIDLPKDARLLYLQADEQFSLANLCREKAAHKVISFGVPAADMGVQALVSAYQPVEIEDIELLLAHDISAIYNERQSGGKQMSGALWNALKLLFKL